MSVATPQHQLDDQGDPIAVVEQFFAALQSYDRRTFDALLADDIGYTNVSLPTIHGRRSVGRFVDFAFSRLGLTFEVKVLNISADGPIVLSERIDVVNVGPIRIQFWALSRYEIRDGKLAVWRDYYDYYDLTLGTMRGLLGAFIPRLRPSFPEVIHAIDTKMR